MLVYQRVANIMENHRYMEDMEVYFAGKSHGYPRFVSDSGSFMKQWGLFNGETWDGQLTLVCLVWSSIPREPLSWVYNVYKSRLMDWWLSPQKKAIYPSVDGIQRERCFASHHPFPNGVRCELKEGEPLHCTARNNPSQLQVKQIRSQRQGKLINGRTVVPTVTGFLFVSARNDTLPDLVSLCNG